MGGNYKSRSCTCACDGLKLMSPGGRLKEKSNKSPKQTKVKSEN